MTKISLSQWHEDSERDGMIIWLIIWRFYTNTGSLLSIRGYNLNFSNFFFLLLLLGYKIFLVLSPSSEHCLRHNHTCW